MVKRASPLVLTSPNFDQPFVVESDASSVAVGAILAQRKEDKRVHPIQYASRTMTSAERIHSAEREALAVIPAPKTFGVYLLSTHTLTLITDHQALRYAFKRMDIYKRLARWMDFLAACAFEVKYRPGGKNGAADFLSRLKAKDKDVVDPVDKGDPLCSVEARLAEEVYLETYLIDILRCLSGREMTYLDA